MDGQNVRLAHDDGREPGHDGLSSIQDDDARSVSNASLLDVPVPDRVSRNIKGLCRGMTEGDAADMSEARQSLEGETAAMISTFSEPTAKNGASAVELS